MSSFIWYLWLVHSCLCLAVCILLSQDRHQNFNGWSWFGRYLRVIAGNKLLLQLLPKQTQQNNLPQNHQIYQSDSFILEYLCQEVKDGKRGGCLTDGCKLSAPPSQNSLFSLSIYVLSIYLKNKSTI